MLKQHRRTLIAGLLAATTLALPLATWAQDIKPRLIRFGYGLNEMCIRDSVLPGRHVGVTLGVGGVQRRGWSRSRCARPACGAASGPVPAGAQRPAVAGSAPRRAAPPGNHRRSGRRMGGFMAQARLLVLDDEATVGQILVMAAQAAGFEARCCEDLADFTQTLITDEDNVGHEPHRQHPP